MVKIYNQTDIGKKRSQILWPNESLIPNITFSEITNFYVQTRPNHKVHHDFHYFFILFIIMMFMPNCDILINFTRYLLSSPNTNIR